MILWIRLSAIFGYPTALPGLRTISKVFGEIPEFKDSSYTWPPTDIDELSQLEQHPTQPYILSEGNTVPEQSKTSLYYSNYPFVAESQPEPNDTRIISIVRVSSTSVVKPKRLDRVTKSVSTNVSKKYFNIASNAFNKEDVISNTNHNASSDYKNMITSFVSLLRKTKLEDDDETDSKETSTVVSVVNSTKSKMRNIFSLEANTSAFDPTSHYFDSYSGVTNAFYRRSKSINETVNSTEMKTEQITDPFTEVYQTSRKEKSDSVYFDSYEEPEYVEQQIYDETEKVYSEPEKVYGEPEKVYGEPEKLYSEPAKVYGEPEKVYGEPEKVYGEPEKMYGEPEKVYGEPEKVYDEPEKEYEGPEKNYGDLEKIYEEPEKYKSEAVHKDPEIEFVKQVNNFELPESSENSNSYSLFTTRVNDKKSSFIIDNGTHRKYRVEEKTPDGFIVGEYGMVSHRDGSLRGVRYTADSNINPSLIYETLVKFLSLK